MVREELKSFDEKAPSGWEGTVKALKKHGDEVDNPWALAHWMKKKGYKSHKESVNEAFVNNLKQAMSYIHTDTKDGAEFMKLMKQKSYNKKQAIRAFTLGMRGDAVHGAGPGGMSQFARHVTRHLKESVNEALPKLKFGGQKDNPTRDKLRGELAKQHKAVVKLFDKSQGKVPKEDLLTMVVNQKRMLGYLEDSLKKLKESVNEGFTKYHIRLTDTPGWYGVWDKKGKQKFEGDKIFVMKNLKKLKTRMGNFQLKSLIDVATKMKGRNISFDVVESVRKEAKKMRFTKDGKRIISKSVWLRMPDYAKLRKNGVEHVLSSDPKKKGRSKYIPVQIESVNEGAKAKTGDYVKTMIGVIARIEKVRGTIAYMKLQDKKSKGYWLNDLKNLKSTDKMEKGKPLWTEGFGGELKGKDKEKFEKARKENAEQLGYKLTGKKDIREAIKFSKEEMKQLHQNGKLEKDGHTYVYKGK